jgi:hypothetical protein
MHGRRPSGAPRHTAHEGRRVVAVRPAGSKPASARPRTRTHLPPLPQAHARQGQHERRDNAPYGRGGGVGICPCARGREKARCHAAPPPLPPRTRYVPEARGQHGDQHEIEHRVGAAVTVQHRAAKVRDRVPAHEAVRVAGRVGLAQRVLHVRVLRRRVVAAHRRRPAEAARQREGGELLPHGQVAGRRAKPGQHIHPEERHHSHQHPHAAPHQHAQGRHRKLRVGHARAQHALPDQVPAAGERGGGEGGRVM